MIKKVIRLYQIIFWNTNKYAKRKGVKVGKNCTIRTRHFGSEPYLVTLEDNVCVTAGVKFYTHGAARMLRHLDPNFNFFGKIVVRKNAYIGEMSLIMPGVIIGENVIIGAGSVVTKSVPDNMIVAGNPARIVGDINRFIEKHLEFNIPTKGMNAKEKRDLIEQHDDESFIKKPFLKKDENTYSNK